MISKEEIEKLLSCNDCDFNECRQCEISYTDKKNIIEYIEQLETDKQKLIDKLEKRREKNNGRYGMAIDNDEFPEMYEYSGQVKEDEYILKILKGEKS